MMMEVLVFILKKVGYLSAIYRSISST